MPVSNLKNASSSGLNSNRVSSRGRIRRRVSASSSWSSTPMLVGLAGLWISWGGGGGLVRDKHRALREQAFYITTPCRCALARKRSDCRRHFGTTTFAAIIDLCVSSRRSSRSVASLVGLYNPLCTPSRFLSVSCGRPNYTGTQPASFEPHEIHRGCPIGVHSPPGNSLRSLITGNRVLIWYKLPPPLSEASRYIP